MLAAGGHEVSGHGGPLASCGSLWWLPKMAIALACAVVLVQGRTCYVAAGVALMLVIVLNNSIDLAVLGAL